MSVALLFQHRRSELWTRGWVSGFFADLAYERSEERLERRLRRLNMEVIGVEVGANYGLSLTDPDAIVVRGPGVLVVAVGGTEADESPYFDLVNDAEVYQVPFEGALVHGGFARAASAILPKIAAYLAKQSGEFDVWLCGHSLGGAVAQLIGFGLSKIGIGVSGVVSLGAPRVGGLLWGAAITQAGLADRYELWVNDDDLIPRLPPVLSLGMWVHVGAFHHIEWRERRIKFFGSNRDLLENLQVTRPSTDDHKLFSYRQRILALMPDIARFEIASTIVGEVNLREVIQQSALGERVPTLSNAARLSDAIDLPAIHRNERSVRNLDVFYL